MSNSYRLVIFDWEGTLADTLGQIIHIVSHEAQSRGFGQLDPADAYQYVSLGLVLALQKLFPHLNHAQHQQLLQAIHQTISNKPAEIHLMPGARAFVTALDQAGVHLAIASNKGPQSLQRALQSCQLDTLFKVTRAAGQSPAKPDPQMLEEIMTIYGVEASSTLMIGDSITDIETAINAGVTAIGVDFYHLHETALLTAGAKKVFDDYQQLAAYLGFSL